MGLLDMFGGGGNQSQGLLSGMSNALMNMSPGDRALLSAGASMLEASGPSRTPVSLGQVLGRGVNGGLSGLDEGTAMQQQQAFNALKLQGVQQELDQKQIGIDQQRRIKRRLADMNGPGQGSNQSEQGDRGAADDSDMMRRVAAPFFGQPYTHDEAQRAYLQAEQAGMTTYDPNMLNRIMAQNRAGMGAPNAPQGVSSGQPQSMVSAAPGGPMSPKIGGPDWLKVYQQNQSQGGAMQGLGGGAASGAPAQKPMLGAGENNQTRALVNRFVQQAQIFSEEGDIEGANKLLERAAKFIPDVHKIEVGMNEGKPVNVIYFKDGSQQIAGYDPTPKYHYADLGNKVQPINEYTGRAAGAGFNKGLSPDTAEVSRREAGKVDPMQVENVATMISEGRMAPLGAMAMRTPFGVAVMSRVADKNPSYRAQDFNTMSKADKDFATGKQGNAVRSFNVLLSHLGTLDQLSDALNNGDMRAFNQLGNAISKQTGSAAPTNFEAVKHIVGDEAVKAVVGSSGALGDRAAIAATIDAANSPAQLKGVINSIKDLAVGQLAGLDQQYQQTTGRKDFSRYLSGDAQSLYAKHGKPAGGPDGAGAGGGGAGAGQFSVTAPNGKTYTFQTAKDLANFKLTAGIK